MRIVDLRSDTVTRPTAAMRKAMASAHVGDDVFGDDPTVNRLEAMAAEMMEKEASLFVASGTMANLVAELTHCGRGDEMIVGDESHIFTSEQGGSAGLGGIHPRTVANRPDGTLALCEVEAAVRTDDIHYPRTRLIAVENTHNHCNGSPLSEDYMHRLGELARGHGLSLHVDGARLFNAAVALGVEPRRLVADADSVAFCLSKGLGAPAGSMVCGSGRFISEARRYRKVLGGGMRQVGVLAAAGIVALEEMVERLVEDHENARRLAQGLAGIEGLRVDAAAVRTNIVFAEVTREDLTAAAVAHRLDALGVRVLVLGRRLLRAVTHWEVTRDDIDSALGMVPGALA